MAAPGFGQIRMETELEDLEAARMRELELLLQHEPDEDQRENIERAMRLWEGGDIPSPEGDPIYIVNGIVCDDEIPPTDELPTRARIWSESLRNEMIRCGPSAGPEFEDYYCIRGPVISPADTAATAAALLAPSINATRAAAAAAAAAIRPPPLNTDTTAEAVAIFRSMTAIEDADEAAVALRALHAMVNPPVAFEEPPPPYVQQDLPMGEQEEDGPSPSVITSLHSLIFALGPRKRTRRNVSAALDRLMLAPDVPHGTARGTSPDFDDGLTFGLNLNLEKILQDATPKPPPPPPRGMDSWLFGPRRDGIVSGDGLVLGADRVLPRVEGSLPGSEEIPTVDISTPAPRPKYRLVNSEILHMRRYRRIDPTDDY